MNRARNNGIYAAENILKQRTKDGKVWYLMKWKGYSPRFNTWEPEENVLDDRLLKAYRKRLVESKGRVKRKRAKVAEEEEGNPSEAEVDVEGVEATETTPEPTAEPQSISEEMPETSVEQPVESVRKWRKRRKPNTDIPTEIPKDVPESTAVVEPDADTSTTTEPEEIPEDKETSVSDTTACVSKPRMTELTVEIPEEENPPKTLQTSPILPVIEQAVDSQEPEHSLESPTSSAASLPVTSTADIPSIAVTILPSPSLVSPKRLPTPDNTTAPEERKLDSKHTLLEKKNVIPKSSHFDFLANSIIITDVTTEKGTVTVKECSAYGDFFGPDLDKPQ